MPDSRTGTGRLPQAVVEVLVSLVLVERGPRFAFLLRERLEAKRV